MNLLRALAIGVASLSAGLAAAPSRAADPPPRWSGFYLGGHLGFLSGTTGISDGEGTALFGGDVVTPGFVGGLQAGYDWLFAPQWLVGLQADASLASGRGSNTCLQTSAAIISSNCRVTPRGFATLTGRVGGLTEPGGRTLLYGKGGLAWMRTDIAIEPNAGFPTIGEPGSPTSLSLGAWGWTIGGGIEHAFAPGWSLFAEYDYLRFDNVSMPTPLTVVGTSTTTVSEVPAGTAGLAFDQHVVKIGLNWRFGGSAESDPAAHDGAAPPAPWSPGWEFALGTRYWYSSGRYSNSNGGTDQLVSRLTYTGMQGHSGELFARLDAPFDVFVKAVAGGGFIASGRMYDEDWGHAASDNPPDPLTAYSRSDSELTGSMNYFTADLGYDLLRGPGHKVGPFVGYNRFQVVMSAMGCAQLVNPSPGICDPATPTNTNGISELDTWQSLRLGVSGEVKLADRLELGGDVAYLPYVVYDGLDIHHLRRPVVYFPWRGTGQGVQADLILSWRATDAFSIGLGGRYWAMWTTYASQTDSPGNILSAGTEWTGVLVQASYRFVPR